MESSTKKRLLALLNSRKTLVVLCAIITMLGAKLGLDVNDEMVMSIAAVAVALVFAIAGEDMAVKATDGGKSNQIERLRAERDAANGSVADAIEGWRQESQKVNQAVKDMRSQKEIVKFLEGRINDLEALKLEKDALEQDVAIMEHTLDDIAGESDDGARMENEGGTPDG